MLLSWAFQKTKVKVHYPKNQRMDSNGNDKHAPFWNKLFFTSRARLLRRRGFAPRHLGLVANFLGVNE
ncbi:MAG: hypothetical protein JW388_0741 [Nitrospira sp.]|nr:hypothetical protein [Nitrospira sp.]